MPKNKSSDKTQKSELSFIHRGGMPFLSFIAFAVIFFTFSKILQPYTADIDNANILEFFEKYAPFAGVILGIASMILMYILYIFRAIFRLNTFLYSAPIALIFAYVPWIILGYQLAYIEPRYAMAAKAIISFGGLPMLYSGAIMAGVGFLWIFIILFARNRQA